MSRRNPGEGTISQRPDGRWQASLQAYGVRKVVYGLTEKEARNKLRELQRQVAVNNALPNPGRRTVGDLLDEWLKTIAPSLKPYTLQTYRYTQSRYISPYIGHIRLSQLEPLHLQRLYGQLVDQGLHRGAAQVHTVLHRALKIAVLWNWLTDNPADKVLKPSYRPERKDVWSQEELSLFLEATQGHWLHPLWVTLISTGMRLGEALALRWEDIGLVGRTLSIRRSIQRIGKEWVETTPKTRAGERAITVPPEAIEALKRQRIIQAERRLRAGPSREGSGLVFTGPSPVKDGQPLFPSVAEHSIKKTCQRLRIKPVSPHGLRHLHASLLLSKGLPVTNVAQRLGHANPAITMQVYAHAMKRQDEEAARAIQAVLERR